MKCQLVFGIILLVVACLFVVTGFVAPVLINSALISQVKKLLVIDSADAQGYDTWKESNQTDSVPYYVNFYLFNLTNPENVIAGTEKPKLKQLGPYCYRKYTIRYKVSFPDNGNYLSSKSWIYYLPDSSKTVGDPLTDRITTVNLPFQGVRAGLGTNWWQTLVFDLLASKTNSSIFNTYVVNDLIFGFQDPLLTLAHELTGSGPTQFQLQINQTSLEESDNTTLWDTFDTGKSDINNILQFQTYQNQTKLTFWGSDSANRIHGTDATQFKMFVEEDDILVAFVNSAFRTVNLTYSMDVVVEGITLKGFRISPTNLQNSTEYPSNADYYQFGPTGVGNMTACSAGVPIFLSQPHFLNADPIYLEGVEGLHPNPDIHDSHINVEPLTGITMKVQKRLQVNAKIEDILLLYPNITPVLLPVTWIEELAEITPDLAKKFRDSVYFAENLIKYGKWASWIGAPILALVAVFLAMLAFLQGKRNKGYAPLSINDSEAFADESYQKET